MLATVLSLFGGQAIGKIAGKIGNAIVDFVLTPFGAAILAAAITYGVTKASTTIKVNREWTQKWEAAEKQAEVERLERDAKIRNEISRSVASRIATLEGSESALNEKVRKYEAERATAGLAGAWVITDADERRLRDIGQTVAKPKAGGGFIRRLRSTGAN